jgi:hypothetical protein
MVAQILLEIGTNMHFCDGGFLRAVADLATRGAAATALTADGLYAIAPEVFKGHEKARALMTLRAVHFSLCSE